MLAAGSSSALAAGYTVSGTIISADESKHTIVLETSDINGRDQPITIDVSMLPDDEQTTSVGSAISLQVEARESDTYLALGSTLDEGNPDRETQGASIRAHVGNGPDDDEAFNQQHRGDDLRRQQDDDSSNGGDSGD
jgi:hypothetical protein